MKQAVIYGGHEVRLEEGPRPVPGKAEALVRVHACGICGSDMHVYHAPKEYIKTPWVAGHEAAGEVEELGASVTGFAVGDRVAVEPTVADETSPLTKIGRYELGIDHHIGGPGHAGAFAEYVVAPVSNLHHLPDGLSYVDGAIAEVYAVSAHALTLFPVQPGESVLVIGTGPVGLTVAELARLAGAEPLIVIGKPDAQLKVAEDALGAVGIHADSDSVKETVLEATGGRGADVVFEAVGGAAPTLQQSVDLAALMGRVCVIGGYTKPCELNTGPARMKELVIGWSFCYGRRGFRKEFDIVLDLLAAGRLDPTPWITHRFSLSEIAQAYATTADRESGSIKVIVEP